MLEDFNDLHEEIQEEAPPITAIILCGGQGTRLQPVIGDTPKCLAPVAGRPFIHYVIKHLERQPNIRRVVFCTGYKGDLVEHIVLFTWYSGRAALFVQDPQEVDPLGTARALKRCLSVLKDDNLLLILNGDTFCPFDLEDLLAAKEISGFHALILNSFNPEAPLDGTCAGVYLVDKKVIEAIPEGSEKLDWDEWLKEYGRKHLTSGVLHYHTKIQFHDIGTPEGYASAEHFLKILGAFSQEKEKEEQDGIQSSE